jgi:hypothetical protein
MSSLRRSFACLAIAVLATACASPSPGAAKHEAGSQPSPPPTAKAPEAGKAPVEPTPLPTPKTAEPEPPPKLDPPLLGRDHRSVVACTTNADCGWDDDCMPTRCVGASPREACDESGPPPGACSCLEGACTLEPKLAPTPSGTCEPRACMLDRAAGKCVADDGGVAENIRSAKPVDVGPSCDCIKPAEGCVFQWFAPVPCKTDRDCWIDPSPRRHPIARPKALRKRDFRPCADGEAAPKCGPAGHCVVGPAYSC